MVKTAPPPGALAAVTRPACSAATAATMASPRPAPVPALGRVLLPEAVEDVDQGLVVQPGPVVAHLGQRPHPSRAPT